MGNWNINIQGVGCHHNTNHETDADKIAQDLVDKLVEAGQHIENATFTSGGKTQLVVKDHKPE